MKYSLRYSPEAMRDMDAVWDDVYEASKSYDIADNYVCEFANKIKAKRQHPQSGIPILYRGLFTGFYYMNYKKYKAFYRINDKYIEVVRVIMSKKDYMTVLFGNELFK